MADKHEDSIVVEPDLEAQQLDDAVAESEEVVNNQQDQAPESPIAPIAINKAKLKSKSTMFGSAASEADDARRQARHSIQVVDWTKYRGAKQAKKGRKARVRPTSRTAIEGEGEEEGAGMGGSGSDEANTDDEVKFEPEQEHTLSSIITGRGSTEHTPLLTRGRLLGAQLQRLLLESWIVIIFALCMYVALGLACIFVWNDMSWRAYLALFTVASVIVALLADRVEAYVVLLLALTFLLACDVIKPKGALQGFSNPGVIVIAVLFIVAEGIRRSRILDVILYRFLGEPRTVATAVLRVSIPVVIASAFLNNTPLVAMLIPVMESWGKRIGIPPSKLLMPLSFAAILGGTCTLIGTSTNLIVVGLAEEKVPNFKALNIFEISLVGAPVAVCGMVYIAIAAKWLLPDNGSSSVDMEKNPREYTAPVRVERRSSAVNKSIADAGFKNLPGITLFGLERGGRLDVPVAADKVIQEEDILLFSGVVSSINLLWDIKGIAPATSEIESLNHMLASSKRSIIEAGVAPHSPIVGKTVKKAQFPKRYNAAIIGINRHTERIQSMLGDVVLRGGDTLLLLAHPKFLDENADNTDFALVREVAETTSFRKPNYVKMLVSLSFAGFMIAMASTDTLPLLTAAMIAAAGMVITQCMSLTTAKKSVGIPIIITIAAAFGLADALESTGAATRLAQTLIDVLQPLGAIGMLAGLYFATALMSAFISNSAAVALMFPIIYAVIQSGADITLKSAIYVLMLAASSSFSTSIGYQTNLMVAGPAGYRMMDFIKFGLPLQIIDAILSIVLCWVIFG